MLEQVQDEMTRLNQWSGQDYEGEVPVTGPSPLTVEPTDQDDPTDTVEEIRDLVDLGDNWTNTQESDGLVTFAQVEAARARGEQWALDVVWTQEEIDEAERAAQENGDTYH